MSITVTVILFENLYTVILYQQSLNMETCNNEPTGVLQKLSGIKSTFTSSGGRQNRQEGVSHH